MSEINFFRNKTFTFRTFFIGLLNNNSSNIDDNDGNNDYDNGNNNDDDDDDDDYYSNDNDNNGNEIDDYSNDNYNDNTNDDDYYSNDNDDKSLFPKLTSSLLSTAYRIIVLISVKLQHHVSITLAPCLVISSREMVFYFTKSFK